MLQLLKRMLPLTPNPSTSGGEGNRSQYALRCLSIVIYLSFALTQAHAGIYISTEKLVPKVDLTEFCKQQLPFLRGYGPPDVTMGGKPTPHREDFLKKVQALRAKGRLTPDEQADLGGYLLYLKQATPRQPVFEEAVTALEGAQRSNPRHFALAANLGTAYQMVGKLDAAERCLQTAVDLAPPEHKAMEQLHLRLVQLRLRENLGRGMQPDLDLLFGRAAAPFRFVDITGKWNYGILAPAEVEKLPGQSTEQAMKQVQQLLVWLPDDGRLHWQLAEWALVQKQPIIAVELYRDAVNTFRLSHPSLKLRRALVQEASHWKALLDKLGNKQPMEVWLARTLGQSLGSSASLDGVALDLLQLTSSMPVRKRASDLFGGGGDGGPAQGDEPNAKPFEMQPWHWGLVVLGCILAILMLYWQLSEWFRRPVKT